MQLGIFFIFCIKMLEFFFAFDSYLQTIILFIELFIFELFCYISDQNEVLADFWKIK